MKKAHKAFVTQAIALRKAIKVETLAIADLEADLASAERRLLSARQELSKLETEAANDGLSVVDLHNAATKALS